MIFTEVEQNTLYNLFSSQLYTGKEYNSGEKEKVVNETILCHQIQYKQHARTASNEILLV